MLVGLVVNKYHSTGGPGNKRSSTGTVRIIKAVRKYRKKKRQEYIKKEGFKMYDNTNQNKRKVYSI